VTWLTRIRLKYLGINSITPLRRRFFWTGGAPPPLTKIDWRAASDIMKSAHRFDRSKSSQWVTAEVTSQPTSLLHCLQTTYNFRWSETRPFIRKSVHRHAVTFVWVIIYKWIPRKRTRSVEQANSYSDSQLLATVIVIYILLKRKWTNKRRTPGYSRALRRNRR